MVGSRQSKSVSYSVMQAIYLAVALAMIILIIGAFTLNPVLNAMDLEDGVHIVAHDYLIALSLGIIPLFVYNALRAFIDALGQTRISMIITLCALPINVLFNYLFIYGKFGFPELGGVGSGYATAITYWLIALVAILVVIKINPFSTYEVFSEFFRVSWKEWKALLLIGVPIGLAIFLKQAFSRPSPF